MKWKLYRSSEKWSGGKRLPTTEEGDLSNGKEAEMEHGDSLVIEVSPGVFVEASTSEWGGVVLTEKPDDWDSSAADRIKPLGEGELPATPPADHMCRTRLPNDDYQA